LIDGRASRIDGFRGRLQVLPLRARTLTVSVRAVIDDCRSERRARGVDGLTIGCDDDALLVERLHRDVTVRGKLFVSQKVRLRTRKIDLRLVKRVASRSDAGRILGRRRGRIVRGLRVTRDVFAHDAFGRNELRREVVGELSRQHLARPNALAFHHVDFRQRFRQICRYGNLTIRRYHSRNLYARRDGSGTGLRGLHLRRRGRFRSGFRLTRAAGARSAEQY
jgi:predicted RNA-binding protein YlqC (UPF0109 family)